MSKKEHDCVIWNGEVLEYLRQEKTRKFDLIITSPPYNVGKTYESKTSIKEYLKTQKQIIKSLVEVLSDNGSICWQVGNYVNCGEVFPLDIFYYDIFIKMGLKLRNRIIWHFGHGLHASNRFSGRYEVILWFTKSDDYIFNLDKVRIPSKYPGKLHYKGPNKGKPSGNPLGKNPSDVWEILEQDWDSGFWEIPNVKSNHPEKTIHPCQFPIELVERCLLALTNENSWVLDPFGGVGTTAVAALKHKRRCVSVDKESIFCEIAKERIKALNNGTLRMRALGQPIHQPSANDKVARIPLEWQTNNLPNI